MQVKEVNNLQDIDSFLRLPNQLYKNDPNYVCHLYQDIEDIFNPNINLNFAKGKAKRWLLLNPNQEVIGRIAAFYQTQLFLVGEPNLGGIGFFECIHSQEAANLLFDTAKTWLIGEGMEGMKGPINFGEKDKFWGLLVNGFENPSYQENYNFPYYQALFEAYGFEKVFEQTTSETSLKTFQKERFEKLSARVLNNPAYRFEHYRAKDLEKFANDFITIYNQAWEAREDFVPITFERIQTTLHSLKPIMMEDAIWFAYANNEPAGFYVNVMDVNQIFKHVKGKMNLWGKLTFLWYRYFGKITRIRGIVFGVIPKYQNLGLETGLIMRLYNAMQKHPHITNTELSWIGDFNPKMHSLFKALGAQTTKIHYTYQKIF